MADLHFDSAANDWLTCLAADLQQTDAQQKRRSLRSLESSGPHIRFEGRELINLASNDYLGLSQHPHLCETVAAAAKQWGVGSGASRLVGGTFAIHTALEARLARFKHAQAALLFPTGYMANLAVLTSLAGQGDMICLDKLTHASLIDAARSSGATVRVFPHGDLDKLRRLLERWHASIRGGKISIASASGPRRPRALVVTDSVFSMDGDVANLPELCAVATAYHAIVIVDEAHGTGVLGKTGAGLCELQQVLDQVDIVISTASKALGSLGGIVTARQVVIDTLINHARSFIYTTGIPPTQVAAIGAALDVVSEEPWRRERVLRMSRYVCAQLQRMANSRAREFRLLGTPEDQTSSVVTPIIPLVTGSAERALALSQRLMDQGFFAPAIRPPTVAPNASRVRLSLRADLTDGEMDRLLEVLACGD